MISINVRGEEKRHQVSANTMKTDALVMKNNAVVGCVRLRRLLRCDMRVAGKAFSSFLVACGDYDM